MKKTKLRFRALALSLVMAALPQAAWPKPRSFNEVKEAVYASPLDAPPARSSISGPKVIWTKVWAKTVLDWIRLKHGAEVGFKVIRQEFRHKVKEGTFAYRILSTLLPPEEQEPDDFKDDEHAKFIHPMGVCAAARWKIDRPVELVPGRQATGLFAPSAAPVNAIIRVSTARDDASYSPGSPRAFGFGLKLFPAPDADTPVRSRNVLFFDQWGLLGSDRPYALRPGKGGQVPQFVNFINDRGVGWLLSPSGIISQLFGFFDAHPGYRPLAALAEVASDGSRVELPVAPTFLVLRPRVDFPVDGPASEYEGLDFLQAILDYDGRMTPRVFDVFASGDASGDLVYPKDNVFRKVMTERALALHAALAEPASGTQGPVPIGTLTVNRWVVSTECDLRLHFAHDPN